MPSHVIEPKYPGAVEQIIPLSDCWNQNKLFDQQAEIVAAFEKNHHYHDHCARFLSAAGTVLSDSHRIALEATDTQKIARFCTRFAQREFQKTTNKNPRESVRFLSAITNKGIWQFNETAANLCDRLYFIDDSYGAASRLVLAGLRAQALEAGYNIITCYCPLSPYDKIDHLFLPELGIGFMTMNFYHPPINIEPYRIIHMRRFTDLAQLKRKKNRLSFNKKVVTQLLEQSSDLLASAKESHDALEQYYINSMDFEKLNAATQKVIDTFTEIVQSSM